MFRALLQADVIRAESACARARAQRQVLLESISELQELLADSATMDREQVATLKTRFLQRMIELDRFERDVAKPAEEMRDSTIERVVAFAQRSISNARALN